MLPLRIQHENVVHRGRKIAVLLLIICLMLVWVTGLLPINVSASTTREELNEARVRQQSLSDEKDRLARINKQLDEELDELSGQLSWLNARSDEQKAVFREKTTQLEAAVAEMEKAFADYVAAEEDLENKQIQYGERIRTMFEYQQMSILEVFLSSRSLQGFFSTLQFMSIIADTDQQMIEDLQIGRASCRERL